MSVFGERLRSLREEQKLTIEQLADRLGIGKSALTNYELGYRRPKKETMDAILDYFNVSLEWMDGKTEIKNVYNFSGIYDAGYKAGLKDSSLTKQEFEFMKKYRNLSIFNREVVNVIVDKLSEANQENKSAEQVHYRTLICYGGRPSAGTGNWLPDETSMSQSQIQVVDSPKTRKADFVLEVDGSSMEPKFSDGDMILVKSQNAIDIGEIGVFQVNGQAVVKQCQEGYLHSLNPSYDDIQIDENDDVICFGKVIGKI